MKNVEESGGISTKIKVREKHITRLLVYSVVLSSKVMGVAAENSVLMSVILSIGLIGGIEVTTDQFESEKNYQISLIIAKRMLSKGLIERKEFEKINATLIRKYHPLIGSL